MEDYEFVTPSAPGEWRAYHDIRREVLFEARGHVGVYDENRLDERQAGHHPKLLFCRADAIEFYRACGFSVEQERTAGPSANEPVFMTKSCL